MKKTLTLCVSLLLLCISSFAQIRLSAVSGSSSLGFNADGGVAEITAYDKITKQLYVVNGNANTIIVYNFATPETTPLTTVTVISISGSGSINSISCKNGLLALTYENATDRQLGGFVQLITTTGNTLIGSPIQVGAQPDMITFTPNGNKLLVANEGEANAGFTVDPEGSVTIIDVTNPLTPTVQTVSLTSLNGAIPHLSTFPNPVPSILIGGMINSQATITSTNLRTPSTVAQDLEPEYITVSPDGATAWVSCQENNAMLIINVNTATLTTIIGFGYKNHNLPGNGLDIGGAASNAAAINIRNWPVKGIYMPDGIAVQSIAGVPYIFSANEGDGREYRQNGSGQGNAGPRTFQDERDLNTGGALASVARLSTTAGAGFVAAGIANLTASGLRFHAGLGAAGSSPYLANTVAGDNINVGNIYNELYTYGTRSFSIWNGLTGALVWDSGDQIERNIFNIMPQNFNVNHNGGSNTARARSNRKGPEPESVVTGVIGDSIYAFVGLERVGGVMVFNVTNPNAPYFRQYINDRNFSVAPNSAAAVDLGPEGLLLIQANESPDGKNYLLVSNEVSGTIRTYLLDYTQNITKTTLRPFITAANQTESAVQILSLSGSGFLSPLSLSTAPSFRFSLSSTTGFSNFDSFTFAGNTLNLQIYVKYVGLSSYGTTSLLIQDANSKIASSVELIGIKTTTSTGTATYTLQMLHASDFEAGLAALDNAPRFAAIWSKFNADYANTLRVSGGDNFLPSPFFNAAADGTLRTTFANINNAYLGGTNGGNFREGIGRGDINIMNLLDLHASAVGNHEFDAGTGTFLEMIGVNYNDNTNPTQVRWAGTRFPYLSCNLDFSGDANLAPLYTSEIRSSDSYKIGPTPASILALSTNQRRKIAPATIVTIGGEVIGIIGATTQIVSKISSTGGVVVRGTNVDDMPLLASQIQLVVDELRARGINKIVLLSHLQQISNEKALAPLLSGVDIIVAAGSHTLMADANDALRAGDLSAETYPFIATDKDGNTTALVSTSSEYTYVGRLVVSFDGIGNLIPQSITDNATINGAYMSTDQGLINAGVNTITAFAGNNSGYLTRGIIEGINASGAQPNAITLAGVNASVTGLVGIRGIVNAQDGNLFGKTQVFLEGRREQVRLQETNIGNLSSDANLIEARKLFPDVMVSFKNGGGIRAAIGTVSAVGGNLVLTPPLANASAGKAFGDVSQLDILNSLRFNNSLSIGEMTATNIFATLNHAVRASGPGVTPGQFAQVGGISFSWDPALAAGSRVKNAAIINEQGRVIDVIAENGTVVGDPSRKYKAVTLSFLLNSGGAGAVGGDSYPLNTATFENRVDLSASLTINGYNTNTGAAAFGTVGGEQDAFAKFMKSNFSTTGFNVMDTPEEQDKRIQNLAKRTDAILPNFSMPIATFSGFTNAVVSISPVSISGMMLADIIRIMAPANVSVDGMAMKTVSGMGGNVNISTLLPASAGVSTFVITLTSASLVKTFTHSLVVATPSINPSITFIGATLTVGGTSIDLSTLLSSNSSGTKSFSIASGTAASLSGNNLSPLSVGSVTVTGMIASTLGFNAGMMMAVFNVVATPSINPSITFIGATLTVGGTSIDLSTLLTSNSSGTKSFSIASGTAASLSGNNLSPLAVGFVTVTGMVASTSGFNAGLKTSIFTIVSGLVCPAIASESVNVNLTLGGTYLIASTISGTPIVTGSAVTVSGNSITAVALGQATVIALTGGVCPYDLIINITVSGTSSITAGADNDFAIYPNPIKDGVLYFTKILTGSVLNSAGTKVKAFEKASTIEVDDLPKGLYLLKVEGKGCQKLIVE